MSFRSLYRKLTASLLGLSGIKIGPQCVLVFIAFIRDTCASFFTDVQKN